MADGDLWTGALFHAHAGLHQHGDFLLQNDLQLLVRLRENNGLDGPGHVFQDGLGVEIAFARFQHFYLAENAGGNHHFIALQAGGHCAESLHGLGAEVFQLFPVFFQRMPGDEEAQDLFFIGQALVLLPFGDGGQLLGMAVDLLFLKDAEKPVLAEFGVALRFLRAFNRLVQHRHELRAIAELIHGPGLDQRFQHALVQQAQVHLLAELEDVLEPAEFRSRGDDGIDGVAAHVLHRRTSDADCNPMD